MNRKFITPRSRPPGHISSITLVLISALCCLNGCTTLPLAVQVVALVGSGASYLTTGKTLTDHAVSSAFERDCRLFRALNGNQICEPQGAIEIAQTSNLDALKADDEAPRDDALPAFEAGQYAVIGSFAIAANAQRWARQHQAFDARVYALERSERPLFRVVVGPINERRSLLQEQFELAGIGDSWKLDLCPNGVECTDG